MKTANGIYYNLSQSEYKFTIGNIVFYFSSRFYQQKFINSYLEERDRFNTALNNVYKDKFHIEFDVLAWIRLYTLIEKRGFYIIVGGDEVTCPEDLAFVGMLNLRKKSGN